MAELGWAGKDSWYNRFIYGNYGGYSGYGDYDDYGGGQ